MALLALLTSVVGLLVAVPVVGVAADPGRQTDRVFGQNRLETAVAISQRAFPSGAAVAYLARSDVFADALAAGTLADGPVLLVPSCGQLPAVVGAELARLAPDRVLALGGPAAVCDSLLVAAAGGRPQGRVAGASRYETAVAISGRGFPDGAGEVYLASASDSPDAVAGGSLTGGPILLVPPTGAPPQVVVDEIVRLAPQRVVALGGSAAVSDQTVAGAAGGRPTLRLAGADRYATAAAIAEHQFGAASPAGGFASVVYLARGDVFADAVAAGSLPDGPVLLVPSCAGLPDPAGAQIARLQPAAVLALGGPGAVCDATLDAAGAVPGAEAVIPDTTLVMDAAARDALRAEEAGGVLVFDAAGAPKPAVGDVLVSYEVPGVAPQGLLREVTSVTATDATVRIGTEPASLTDAIHDGALHLDVPFTRADLIGESGPVAGRQQQASLDLINIDDSETITLAPGVTLTGSLRYNATFQADLDIDLLPSPHLETFVTALSFNEAANLTLTAQDAASWTPDPVTLWEGEFRCFWTAIGPVPVSFCPYVTVEMSASGNVEGQVTMAVGQSASARFGAEYSREGGWSPINTYTHDHTFSPPSLAVTADATATVRAQLGLEVYDLAGPYVYGELYARGEAQITDNRLCWGLYAGIAGGFGVAVDEDLLGELDFPELELVSAESLLAEDPVPHEPCQELRRQGDSWFGTVTLTEDYEYRVTDPNEPNDVVTWHADAVLHLTGAVTSYTYGDQTWDEVAAIVLSADYSEYTRFEGMAFNDYGEMIGGNGCYDGWSIASTGLTEDRHGTYSVFPSADAAVPDFRGASADFYVSGFYEDSCYPEANYTFSELSGFLWQTGDGTPTITAVPGGRQICDTISIAYDHSTSSQTDRQTITATFAIADGTAVPDCPSS